MTAKMASSKNLREFLGGIEINIAAKGIRVSIFSDNREPSVTADMGLFKVQLKLLNNSEQLALGTLVTMSLEHVRIMHNKLKESKEGVEKMNKGKAMQAINQSIITNKNLTPKISMAKLNEGISSKEKLMENGMLN